MLSICYSLIGVFGGIYIFRENFEYILYRHTERFFNISFKFFIAKFDVILKSPSTQIQASPGWRRPILFIY